MKKKYLIALCVLAIAFVLLFAFSSTKKSAERFVTKEQAIQQIRLMPDVQEYSKTLAAAGKKINIEAEDSGDVWNVHVLRLSRTNFRLTPRPLAGLVSIKLWVAE